MLEYTRLDPEFWRKACANGDGFAWWYLDLRAGDGCGLVLLWGLGLPFVPSASGAKEGALQLAFYENGRAEYYHLATFRSFDELEVNGAFSSEAGGVRVIEGTGQLVLEVRLSESSMLGDGFELELDVRGAPLSTTRLASGDHLWSPQTVVATSEGTLKFADRTVRLSGTAYFDTNAALTPLASQPIEVWRWGRLSFGDETVLFYDVEGKEKRETLAFSIDSTGNRVDAEGLEWLDQRRATYGIVAPRSGRVALGGDVLRFHADALVDDGPFYQRYLISGVRGDGVSAEGFYEVVVPGRLDRPWQRPLVAMRIRRPAGQRNSRWLPLFRGPRRGRVRRLLRSWFLGLAELPSERRLP